MKSKKKNEKKKNRNKSEIFHSQLELYSLNSELNK